MRACSMPEAIAPPVSLSRPLESETPSHPSVCRDNRETITETVDLKALARLALSRDSCRDGPRDRVSRSLVKTRWAIETVGAVISEADAERAAIIEYDGAVPREWAEGFARLDPDRPPADVPPRRWLQFVNDVGRFLDSGLAQQAAALGWGPFDLFGSDRDRPFVRIDQLGLLWLLNGNRLFALSTDAAVVENRAGERLTYRRKTVEAAGRTLAWELRR